MRSSDSPNTATMSRYDFSRCVLGWPMPSSAKELCLSLVGLVLTNIIPVYCTKSGPRSKCQRPPASISPQMQHLKALLPAHQKRLLRHLPWKRQVQWSLVMACDMCHRKFGPALPFVVYGRHSRPWRTARQCLFCLFTHFACLDTCCSRPIRWLSRTCLEDQEAKRPWVSRERWERYYLYTRMQTNRSRLYDKEPLGFSPRHHRFAFIFYWWPCWYVDSAATLRKTPTIFPLMQ